MAEAAAAEAEYSAAASAVAHVVAVEAAPAAAEAAGVSQAVTVAAVTAAAAAAEAAPAAVAAALTTAHSCMQMHSAYSTTQQLPRPNEASWLHQTTEHRLTYSYSYNRHSQEFLRGVHNCVIVSKQCADFLISSLATAVVLLFPSQNITYFPDRGCVPLCTLYVYATNS